ncbi:hypothetical protein N665_1526s0007 [Sinapis alba]|nr:hypothetical protein N665_1526s0007 [Sinapis alba]
MASCDDGSDSDIDKSAEEVETPVSRKKAQRKKPEEGSGSKSEKKRTSKVWEHFTRKRKDNDRAICNYCGKEMACATKSGTTSLKKHVTIACKAYQAWRAVNKENNQGALDFGEDGNMRVCKVSETVFREATNEMIVVGELAFAWVESVAWRHFCNKTKLYVPHSRRTATRDIVEMFAAKKAEMKQILNENKQRLSLTTDIWLATHTGSSYMVITAHYIDSLWQLRKLIIGFKNVYDHKGSTICKVLVECLMEWDIKKLYGITVDNATTNSSALRKFKEAFIFLHFRCATHILNLIVKEGLLEIESSVNDIRNAIYFVRSSTQRQISFERHVESRRVQRGSLLLDVRTRWNSTYLMLEQALKFKAAFEKMEAEDKPYNDYFTEIVDGRKRVGPPSREDWEEVERLVQFLIIFYKATLVLSATNSITAHKLYHAIVTV